MTYCFQRSSPNSRYRDNGCSKSEQFRSLYHEDTLSSSPSSQTVTVRSAAELHADDSKKFRQLPCRTFISVGTCPYRERCVYLHDPRLMCRDAKTKSRRKNNEDLVQDSLFWPALPSHEVNQRVDYSNHPHVIQRYHVPCPKNDQYRRHDQAVYSMWMHFVIFCNMKLEKSNSHHHAEAEIAAFAHPEYENPLQSNHSMILPSSSEGFQSNNVHNGHQQCFFLEVTLAVNPFTNVNRLDVFRNLSCGEGLPTRVSSSSSSSVSPKRASTRRCNPTQVSLDARAPTQPAYSFLRNDLQPHFSCKALPILNPHPDICQPLHFDDSFTPCNGRNQLHLSQQKAKDINERNMTLQKRNIQPATSHPYYNEKAGTESAMGLGYKATHLNHVVFSGQDQVTSSSVVGTWPKSSFSSHKQRRTFECEVGKITSLDAGNRAFNSEKKGYFDMDEELKRSLYNLIDVEDTSPSFKISRFSPSEDYIELSSHDLADNYLYFSPLTGRTPEMKSPVNFDMASPTSISNMGSYSPSSVSSILRGSLKNIQSSDFKTQRRQLYGKQEQFQTQLRQIHTQSEKNSDQGASQSQIWQYNKRS